MKFLLTQKIITKIISFAFILIHYISFSQVLKSYKGSYKWGNDEGVADYTYYDLDGKRFFDGKFRFTSSQTGNQGNIDVVITGQFKNGEVNGTWQKSMTGRVKNIDLNSRLTGNFVSGKPDGLFEQRVILLDTTITKIKYKNGVPFGDFYHHNGSSQEKIIAKFAENGMLIGELEYRVKNEAEITTFDNQNRASLVRQYSNGQEFKRVDVFEKVNAMSPMNISWVIANFVKGSDLMSNIWAEGNFGHLNGIGSLNTENLNNMFYFRFQKLVSLKEANFISIDEWKKLDPSKPLSHSENKKLFNQWTYLKENKRPELNERQYIIKSDLSSCDSIMKLFEGIQLTKLEEAYKFQPALTDEKSYIQLQLQTLKEIEQLYTTISATKIRGLALQNIEIDKEIETFKMNFKTQEEHLNALMTQINNPYRLTEWKEKMMQLDSIRDNFTINKTEELSKIMVAKFQAAITAEKTSVQNQFQVLKEIEEKYSRISKSKIGNLSLENIGIDPEIEKFKKDIKTQDEYLNTLLTQINSPYNLLEWKEKLVQLNSISTNFKEIKTDELTEIIVQLGYLTDLKITPWTQNNKKITDLTLDQKEFNDITRIYNVLIEDATAKINVLNTKILDSQFTDLLKIQTKIMSLVENPSENYKPIRKDLKNAVAPAELRTILKL